ncbi:hypothetical protein BDR26DRAFT_21847 [Obelidium mucronatum]|nr:hypothetical protein BDR26DRAFT_21847 [Obelidium mucronatum]
MIGSGIKIVDDVAPPPPPPPPPLSVPVDASTNGASNSALDQSGAVESPGPVILAGNVLVPVPTTTRAKTPSKSLSANSPSGNNNGPVLPNGSVDPSVAESSGSSPITAIGGGIGALIVVFYAVAFFIQQRRRSRRSRRSQQMQNQRHQGTSPVDLPFGRPVKFDDTNRVLTQERVAKHPKPVELPQLGRTKDGKYDPSVVPPKFKSLETMESAGAGGGGVNQSRESSGGSTRRSNSLGRRQDSSSLSRQWQLASGGTFLDGKR